MREILRKWRVLVVDDQPRVVKFIQIDLRLRGFEVLTATSGQDALNLVESAKPDVMLLDITMPEMDGLEVLRRLRAFSEMPVIAFSATPDNSEKALRAGASSFMAKPFRAEELVKKLGFLLDNKPPDYE